MEDGILRVLDISLENRQDSLYKNVLEGLAAEYDAGQYTPYHRLHAPAVQQASRILESRQDLDVILVHHSVPGGDEYCKHLRQQPLSDFLKPSTRIYFFSDIDNGSSPEGVNRTFRPHMPAEDIVDTIVHDLSPS